MIIDTHCHPQFPQYDTDRDNVIRRALDAGVRMICVGTDLETSRQAIALADRYEGLWASVGLHPNDTGEVVPEFETLIQHPKVVAIGEVGLDYYRSADRKEEQKERLKKFIELAARHGKPLIIHCRDARPDDPVGQGSAGAHEDLLSILKDAGSKLCGVIHSFTGTTQQALLYIEGGFHIGLNGIITFARQYDEVVRAISLEKMLLETDAPYLTPVPYRGKRNEPVYISEVANQLAALKGVAVEDVSERTTQNARELFGI